MLVYVDECIIISYIYTYVDEFITFMTEVTDKYLIVEEVTLEKYLGAVSADSRKWI